MSYPSAIIEDQESAFQTIMINEKKKKTDFLIYIKFQFEKQNILI